MDLNCGRGLRLILRLERQKVNTIVTTDDAEIEKLEWARQGVRPRKVFFYEREIGNEQIFGHDFIIIHARNGQRFVCDPTADQFGFSDFFYTYEQYQKNCLDKRIPHKTINPYHTMDQFCRDAGKDRYIKELLEFQKDLRAKAKQVE